MDWAAMVMQMYKMWAQRRRYGVTVVDEMPGEVAGIKVHLLAIFCSFSILFRHGCTLVIGQASFREGNWNPRSICTDTN